MGEALTHVRTGSVTGAARDDAAEGTPRFLAGEAVGFVEEELVAWGDVEETLEAVLAELSREAELVTLIEGDGAPLAAIRWPGWPRTGSSSSTSAAGSPPTGGSSPPNRTYRRRCFFVGMQVR